MKRAPILAIAALCGVMRPALAEDKWVRLRSGPFEVLSNAGERAARDRLYEAEQFRWALGQLLGKKDLTTVWPIRIVVARDKRQSPLTLSRDAWIGAGMDDAWRRQCARILIEDNTNRLPAGIEQGLILLVSTLEIKGTKLALGAPPAERTRDWARMRLLATAPEYFGRMRVFISNLEQAADPDIAFRNAFEKRSAEIEKQVDAALAAGRFEAVPISGRALSEKDFTVREATPHEGAVALADLAPSAAAYQAAGGVEGEEGLQHFEAATQGGSRSARAWLALNTRAGFVKAAELNPRWAEPHRKLAGLEKDPGRKATYLQKAADLEPRDAATWKALALALIDARQFALAAKAWTRAERAAASPQERAQMRQARLDIESQRADYEESERRRLRDEEARDLQRVKNAALEEIRVAEMKANQKMQAERGGKPEQVYKMEDLDKTSKLIGKLERVDCLANGQARLFVRAEGEAKPAQFLIKDPGALAVSGGGEKALGCGPQKPPRAIAIEYTSSREVQTIEFK